jgi:putative ABC transport system substrate-binding protein
LEKEERGETMKRRHLFLSATGALLPGLAFAQPARKVWRIGYLLLSALSEPPSTERAAFLQGLVELGYVIGKTVQIEYRSAEGERDFLPALAAELVREKVDVIFAASADAAQAALTATRTIPIVTPTIGILVYDGLVKSLAHPGGNVTGLSVFDAELAGKRLELLRDALPGAKRVAVVRNPRSSVALAQWEETRRVAAKLGLTLLPFELGTSDTVPKMLASVVRARPDALLLLVDERVIGYGNIFAERAMRNAIPSFAGWSNFAAAGGLISYSPSFPEIFHRAASYVDKILKGAKPGDLPVEQPAKFELIVNMKTAKALGIKIPQSILARADKVIE